MHVTPLIFFSRILRSEALVYKSFFFFRRAVLRKLFDITFSYKPCNFSRVCLHVKMASKTVTRSITHFSKLCLHFVIVNRTLFSSVFFLKIIVNNVFYCCTVNLSRDNYFLANINLLFYRCLFVYIIKRTLHCGLKI